MSISVVLITRNGIKFATYSQRTIISLKKMTEENQPDDIESSEEEWNPITETRQWSAVASELNCFALARRKGKRLVKIINTKVEPFPIICIFEDYLE